MTWWLILLIFLSGLLLLMALGLPVVISFLVVNLGATIILFGWDAGPPMLIRSMYSGLASFTLLPIALFVLMGEVLFRSGVAVQTLEAIGKWLGPLPGRLAVLAMITGTVLAALSGSALATTAMLGSLMVPQMMERGYSKGLSAGAVLAAGSLAMIIPPSNVAILVGSIGDISIGKLLIGGIIPGLLLASLNIGYIIVRCILRPSEGPKYTVEHVTWRVRVTTLFRDILPLTILMFLTVGSILIGLATPTEAAALGAVGAYLLAAAYRRLDRQVLVDSLLGGVRVAGMLLLLMAVAAGFSQFLSFTGATREMVQMITRLDVAPLLIIFAMVLLVTIMGCFLEQVAILMITLPLFMPIVLAFDFNPVWFGLIMLLTVDMANLTPPFGLSLFVIKGVAPKNFTMKDIIHGVFPFIMVEATVIILLIFFPFIGTWLPDTLMR